MLSFKELCYWCWENVAFHGGAGLPSDVGGLIHGSCRHTTHSEEREVRRAEKNFLLLKFILSFHKIRNLFHTFVIFLSKRVCVRAKSLQSCLALGDPMHCNLWGSSVHGIVQARILQWVRIKRLNLHLLRLLHWQAGSLPLAPPCAFIYKLE